MCTTALDGVPVADAQNEFIGFISEFDVLRASEAGQSLSKLTVEDIMVHDRRSGADDGGETRPESSCHERWESCLLRDAARSSASLD